jgi:hypothetical protein
MEKSNYKIELGFEELCLIERALELYGRMGMLQFDTLDYVNSLGKQIHKLDIHTEFRTKCNELKALFGYASNSYPGIFNKEFVGDDCRIATHIYQQLRHQRYLDRIKSGEQNEKHYTVDEYPADICTIARIKLPEFKFIEL